MHLYAFGSVCRGEIDKGSDIDLLAIVYGFDERFDPATYSIYSYERIEELWEEGNPFAWHLHLESKLLFSEADEDFIKDLGDPRKYQRGKEDCLKFSQIFETAKTSFLTSKGARVFDLSAMFLSFRNFATCYSLGFLKNPDFSRNSANNLGSLSIPLKKEIFDIFLNSRLLCTRAIGKLPTTSEFQLAEKNFDKIEVWMVKLIGEAK